MTKRLTITLVALALFVLIAVLPASAISASQVTGRFNGSVILGGIPTATVFLGEDGLNLTPVLTGGTYTTLPPSYKIGWWAPGTFSFPNNPSQVVDVQAGMTNFAVDPNVFGSYTGTWYCLTAAGSAISDTGVASTATKYGPIFIVADPSQSVAAVDVMANQGQGQDMTGKSITSGTILSFKVSTNLASFTVGGRSNTRFVATDPAGWDNGTLAAALPGSNVYLSRPGYGWFNNGTTGTATTIVQYANRSDWTGNVMSAMNYTHTFWFNNSIASATEGNTRAQNFTVDNAGLTLLNAVTDTGPFTTTGQVGAWTTVPTSPQDGFISIKLKDQNGQVQTRVFTNDPANPTASLSNLYITTNPQYPVGNFNGANGIGAIGWNTGALDPVLGTPAYPAGTFSIWTETTLSNIKNNYKLNGADYTGKTLSGTGTITIVSDTVKIEANKETVVRSKTFSVTVTGKPLSTYQIWLKGTSSMTGGYDSQPPMIGLFQDKVYSDTPTSLFPIGAWQYQNGNGRTIQQDVCQDSAVDAAKYNGTRYYALINTSSSGTRTIEFVTTNATKAQSYTIHVERNTTLSNYISDEVDVKVEKGAVTITASGDQSYYLGEEIKFSGTNTETQTTFLFLTGPNLWPAGSRFYPGGNYGLDPRRNPNDAASNSLVMDGVPATFVQRSVNADNTWDWKWGTANYALDAGTYTVFAVSGPKDAQHLGNVAYGTVSIIIKKPFVSATASQSTVAQGDKLFITGTAEGKPQPGIAIWILGKNYANRVTQSVNSDASFSYEVTTATTAQMDGGQYFVVVQHPMQNQIFDIDLPTGSNSVINRVAGGTVVFNLLGSGSLQGTDAAEALAQAITSPNVDDTYTKLVFLVEVPSIRIDPIGDRHVGDKFTITATTNLAVDDEALFEVYSSSFKPTQKSQSGEFSGATGTVKVTKGDTGLNKLSFNVDASTFKPDEYIVSAKWVLNAATTATSLFNVLEGSAPTAVPTKVVVTAAPTAAPTTVATPVPTATPTKTPTQPGFGALVALIGLGAVAFFVVRRH